MLNYAELCNFMQVMLKTYAKVGFGPEGHAMTSIKLFCRKQIAVNPLNPTVLGVPQHQTIEQSKMALALGRLLQFQGFKESIHLCHNMYKTYNAYNSI